MFFDLTGKVAVITGAASGIGAATALRFARAGADVVCAVYSPDGHDTTALKAALAETGRRALFVETDVSQTTSIDNLVAEALREFGRVDIALANAAIVRRCASPRAR